MKTVFDIEQKQNSPEKEAAIVGVPERFYVDDWELNAVNRKALEAAIENVKVEFYWSDKPEHIRNNWNGVSKVQQLVLKFHDEWMLQNTDEVVLLIDRYKAKRTIRTYGKFKGSGFKHGIYPDELNPKRPSEILINDKEMILKIGQPYYFHKITNAHSKIRTRGAGSKSNDGDDRAWQYLQFRIRVKKGNKFFYSNPLTTIQMICNRWYNDGVNQKISISYKLT